MIRLLVSYFFVYLIKVRYCIGIIKFVYFANIMIIWSIFFFIIYRESLEYIVVFGEDSRGNYFVYSVMFFYI